MISVTFNKVGYDPFIDFLKGLCIVSVVLTHNIPNGWQNIIGFPFWGAQAVPVFLLIQSFHYFKHEQMPKINWRKMFKRIILPFVFIQIIIELIIDINNLIGCGDILTPLEPDFLILSGGRGPGSYYFWIYLQFALILLPLFGLAQRKWKLKPRIWLLLFIVVSEILEIFCSIIHLSQDLYYLLAFRYVFLIYGGYIWVKEGVQLNWKTITLSLLSVVAIFLFQYKRIVFEPWVYDTGWRYFHWFCYFWAIYGLIIIANQLFKITGGGVFAEFIKRIGQCSWEIFLLQMVVFEFYPEGGNKWIYLIVTTILSIVPVMLYYQIKQKWQTINK